MSYLVLHMDKFKKDAIRGIQSHNRRERESHSNPDIDYSRSVGNYDLHESASDNYSQTIQNRIDDLLMVKAVRKDAVQALRRHTGWKPRYDSETGHFYPCPDAGADEEARLRHTGNRRKAAREGD